MPYITLRYDQGQHPGWVAYFLENQTCTGYIELVRDYFLDDRDSLGHLIKVKAQREPARQAA